MTSIDDYSTKLSKNHKLKHTIISENFTTRYKKYHRAEFRFKRQTSNYVANNFNFSYYEQHDYVAANRLANVLTKKLGKNVTIRNNWYSVFVYFDDVDELLGLLTKKDKQALTELRVMSADVIKAKNDYKSEFRIELSVVKKLPHNRYRYRVWLVSNPTERKKIGATTISQICNVINEYDGIHGRGLYAFEKIKRNNWYIFSEKLLYKS